MKNTKYIYTIQKAKQHCDTPLISQPNNSKTRIYGIFSYFYLIIKTYIYTRTHFVKSLLWLNKSDKIFAVQVNIKGDFIYLFKNKKKIKIAL